MRSVFDQYKLDVVPVLFYDTVTTYTAFAYAQHVDAPLIQSKETPMQAFVIVFIVAMLCDSISSFLQHIVECISHKPFRFSVMTFFRLFITSVRLATRGYGVRFMVASIGNTGYSGFVFVSLYEIILDYRHYFKLQSLNADDSSTDHATRPVPSSLQKQINDNYSRNTQSTSSVESRFLNHNQQQQSDTDRYHRVGSEGYIRPRQVKTSQNP